MNILITGNLGYVGSVLVKYLRQSFPKSKLIGFDIGYFAKHITNPNLTPDNLLNMQYYGDVREFPDQILEGVDALIHLAAISNDPMGNKYEEATLEINFEATKRIAEKAKKAGVRAFVFASSCSVYGYAENEARKETSTLNPLTAYARSKVLSENALAQLADDNFKVSCFRFATACGFSDRLRLDLVANDFVASAIGNNQINILSDGTPWRPLIHVKDMARAMIWGIKRKAMDEGGNFLLVNTGSNEWNYQVKQIAHEIQQILPKVSIYINPEAAPDKRSYKVDFGFFKKLAPDHQPEWNLKSTIRELVEGLGKMGFQDKNFRQSNLIRLNVINSLKKEGLINEELSVVQ
ncbi:NAD-dependent epimerase/dehydratase family protein [Xanthovirga aplysinae]|uniref:NAD-dependent epimerase/dehydratase family protein n=1 Tax=Xanthovirga aplysinae TaxID=2529853 RepID=UPI0012BD76DC|nr:SDR family oxidoreductase [Xanthovirga aplysinae]MTI31182.1 SDR family oxidoreductase [Xanthovirga aplysinae]